MPFSLKSDIWWHQFFHFPWLFQRKIFPLTFPWPLKFPDFIQFSLTCRKHVSHVTKLQEHTAWPYRDVASWSRAQFEISRFWSRTGRAVWVCVSNEVNIFRHHAEVKNVTVMTALLHHYNWTRSHGDKILHDTDKQGNWSIAYRSLFTRTSSRSLLEPGEKTGWGRWHGDASIHTWTLCSRTGHTQRPLSLTV